MMYDANADVAHVIRQVRFMNRFFNDVVDVEPYREHHAALYCAYMEMLQEEIASHALDLASAVVEWEDWAAENKVR